jgi:polyribonucleotide nucleotidyltransferase
MAIVKVECEIGGRKLVLETGKMAKQADGAVVATYGDCVVLGTSVVGEPRKDGGDFFPLTVDYREKAYAAGKFPGGFFKREGRPTSKEILTMRMIDRPIRPLFPENFVNEVQIQVLVLAADPTLDPDIAGINAASAAMAIGSSPFEGPIGAVRVGYVDGQIVINPTYEQVEASELDMVLAGHKDGVNMIEVGSREVSEQVVIDAITQGFEAIKVICQTIESLRQQVGKPCSWKAPEKNPDLARSVREKAYDQMWQRRQIPGKLDRQTAVKELYDQVLNELSPEDVPEPKFERRDVMRQLQVIEEEVVGKQILETGKRSDGRTPFDVRPISGEVAFLPRTHGSSLFSRGETQAVVVTTLGTARDEQIIDGLAEEYSKKFMLHYNFPPFCVGEARRIMGPGRREIGHGALAERSLEAILPAVDSFPYTIRLSSEIMESNGSSSMASVCGGTLALMDAGVPISQPVAGISIGSVHDDSRRILLTDILGEEDHFGDMDFKVAGTGRGITGIQLDLKERFISMDTLTQALERAREARKFILREMLKIIERPRPETSKYAPRILMIMINPEKIGAVIGPGGKGIRGIEAATGATIDIEDSGKVTVSCLQMEGAVAARDIIEQISEGVKVGKVYTGRVTGIKDFGAFVEIAPGQDGLCHISELSDGFVKSVNEVCKIGDMLKVKVILVDDQGRVKLSRKAVLREESGAEQK